LASRGHSLLAKKASPDRGVREREGNETLYTLIFGIAGRGKKRLVLAPKGQTISHKKGGVGLDDASEGTTFHYSLTGSGKKGVHDPRESFMPLNNIVIRHSRYP